MPNNLDTPQTISIQARLTNIGRRLGIPGDVSQAMRRLYFLDGFLARLAQTPHHSQFVLGGGLFLLKLALGATQARPTQDADFSCLGLSNDATVLLPALQTIVRIPAADAVVFDEAHIRLNTIMQQGPLVGVRARLPARLGNARELLALDLAFGMPLIPGPQLRAVPTTLNPSITIPVYTYYSVQMAVDSRYIRTRPSPSPVLHPTRLVLSRRCAATPSQRGTSPTRQRSAC